MDIPGAVQRFLAPLSKRIEDGVTDWLLHEEKPRGIPLQDFTKLCEAMRPADVVLVEGRSRVGRAIRAISQSPWTHAALYIGRAAEVSKDAEMGKVIHSHFHGDPEEQLLVESLLGSGMIITPLSSYADDEVRICRPREIAAQDAQEVVKITVTQVGREYDVRQLLDLARFIFPFDILPRRWRSSLFHHNAGRPTRAVCSTVLAEAFMRVKFPILPVVRKINEDYSLAKRNPRLFTPRDFDYSPYFEVIKAPYIQFNHSLFGLRKDGYRNLPWECDENIYCNSRKECYVLGEDLILDGDEGSKP